MANNENELESKAIQAASKALSRASSEIPTELTLSNGIVLKLKNIPPLLINSVSNSIPEPEIPTVWIEDKEREEPNPNHPAYLAAKLKRDQELTLATINLILYAGTELKSVPKGVSGPDDDDWIPLAKMAGIRFDESNQIERYLAWLRSYALATLNDLEQAQSLPLKLAGITEEEVNAVADSFRSGEGGGADNTVPTEIGSANGNHVQQSNRRGRRATRGT
jgi:hypothetical protein